MAFPFLLAFINLATGFIHDAPMTVVYTKYSELLLKIINCRVDE